MRIFGILSQRYLLFSLSQSLTLHGLQNNLKLFRLEKLPSLLTLRADHTAACTTVQLLVSHYIWLLIIALFPFVL